MDMRYDDGHTSGLANVIGNVSEIQSEHDLRKKMVNDGWLSPSGRVLEQKEKVDKVNHPSHYNQYNGFEVIDVCEQLRAPDGTGNYNRGNAFKYLARAGWKNADNHVEDLEKAAFYINREIDRIKSGNWMDTTIQKVAERIPGDFSTYPCPVCSLILKANECPDGHGRLVVDSQDHPLWISRSTLKMHPRCPSCDFQLKEDAKDRYHCENGHGSLVVDRWLTLDNGVISKGTKVVVL